MGKKMYYTEEETAGRLGIGVGELATYVRDSKLRVFQDGAKKMFRTDEVDALVGAGQAAAGKDAVSLSEAEATAPPTKEDTVITAEGISIFDDEELEIAPVDPMAKTQIAPSLEDQIGLDGVSSGSGLLDLTRESDDTSLGAEVLDHIDEMEGAVGSGMAAVEEVAPEMPSAVQEVYVEAPATEAMDAGSGLFGGIAVGMAMIVVLLAGVTLAVLTGQVPAYIKALQDNIVVVLLGGVAVVGLAGVIGLLLGKSASVRQAMR